VSTPRETLIVFTRFPVVGRTKTRLIPALGAEGAAELQRRLTVDTLGRAQACAHKRSSTLEIWFEGGDERSLAACFGESLVYRRQVGADLGERMLRAFESALSGDGDRAILIGTDCPDLSPELMGGALEALSRCDVVLGPVRDGGYCLIGLRRPIAALFRNVAWGTSTVMAETLAIAADLALAVETLPILDDIDWPEDLPILARHFGVPASELPRLLRKD
jgi:uncharacterized protein